MRHTKWIGLLLLATCLCPMAASANPYTRKATWIESVLATREAIAAKAKASGVTMTPWQYLLRKKISKIEDFEVTPGMLKGSLSRRAKEMGFADGTRHVLERKGKLAAALVRTITVDKAQAFTATIDPDDNALIYLNGKHIYKQTKKTKAPVNIKLDLQPGKNIFLMVIHNQKSDFGFSFLLEGVSIPEGAIWKQLEADFPAEAGLIQRERGDGIWSNAWTVSVKTIAQRYAKTISSNTLRKTAEALAKTAKTAADLEAVHKLYTAFHASTSVRAQLAMIKPAAALESIDYLTETFPGRYDGAKYRAKLASMLKTLPSIIAGTERSDPKALASANALLALTREAHLANPLLDFDQIICVKRTFGAKARSVMSSAAGFPRLNSHNNNTISHKGWDNEVCILSNLRKGGTFKTLYKIPNTHAQSDLEVNFDATKIMFSTIGAHDRWAVFEADYANGTMGTPRQITPKQTDVDWFDSCYLPDGRVATTSTASFQGLPCEYGSKPMAQLYLVDTKQKDPTKRIEQITYEQDSDWCPTVLPSGQLMYLRWEYSDVAHYFSRVLMSCNPDGTNQREIFGSNSYFPNAFLYARPVPTASGSKTQIVGIVSGHHGISRSGRLIIFDPAKGRREADGAVHEFPHRGRKIEPIIKDRLVDGVWPQFLMPYPLAESNGVGGGKYFLTIMKANSNALWGLYLVDTYDNVTLIKELEGAMILDPIPLRKTPTPSVIADRRIPGKTTGNAYIADIYHGPGLRTMPRGIVKSLRVFSYHFAHNATGGHSSVGVESSWDIKRILGTVPVNPDGSVTFEVPANTPISIQPLDAQGRTLQLMRSWTIARPGETISCDGCHEDRNGAPISRRTAASLQKPKPLTPFQGQIRPFGFRYEIQPILDTYCLSCHKGAKGRPNFDKIDEEFKYLGRHTAGYSGSYMDLHPFVRRPGPESDYHLCEPMEYHTTTSELVQMLKKGHHGVKLDAKAWAKLYTWIDLNAPYRAHWNPPKWQGIDQHKRRLELARRYSGVTADVEDEYLTMARKIGPRKKVTPVAPKPVARPKLKPVVVKGWPFDAKTAVAMQAKLGKTKMEFDLGNGAKMVFRKVPGGQFALGSATGPMDEFPPTPKTVNPFWVGEMEVTNQQYAQFDPKHDTRYINQRWKDHTNPGYPANLPNQPVARISYNQAAEFCAWLSKKTGKACSLPTETQWEWAARAGSATGFSFGDAASFPKFANLSDHSTRLLTVSGVNPHPIQTDDERAYYLPREAGNDGQKIVCAVGQYAPNAWGLYDMHGNVCEWTKSLYRPYAADMPSSATPDSKHRVVRGGSWRDRAKRATSSFRLGYESYQRVFNVGLRVVIAE